jgi:hypothetical protein
MRLEVSIQLKAIYYYQVKLFSECESFFYDFETLVRKIDVRALVGMLFG